MVEVFHFLREDGIKVMPKLLEADVTAIFYTAGNNCAMG
jgi:hypothetical protein